MQHQHQHFLHTSDLDGAFFGSDWLAYTNSDSSIPWHLQEHEQQWKCSPGAPPGFAELAARRNRANAAAAVFNDRTKEMARCAEQLEAARAYLERLERCCGASAPEHAMQLQLDAEEELPPPAFAQISSEQIQLEMPTPPSLARPVPPERPVPAERTLHPAAGAERAPEPLPPHAAMWSSWVPLEALQVGIQLHSPMVALGAAGGQVGQVPPTFLAAPEALLMCGSSGSLESARWGQQDQGLPPSKLMKMSPSSSGGSAKTTLGSPLSPDNMLEVEPWGWPECMA